MFQLYDVGGSQGNSPYPAGILTTEMNLALFFLEFDSSFIFHSLLKETSVLPLTKMPSKCSILIYAT